MKFVLKMKIIAIIFFSFFLFYPYFVMAQGSERVKHFDSQIVVNQDSSIEVLETIDYYFSYARHGIYRYLPYHYEDKDAKKYLNLGYDFLEITMDGQNIPYERSKQNGNWFLKIGDPNKTISGDHEYKIHYNINYVLNYFSSYDELYWNVSGSDWSVPIELTTAQIVLPQKVAEQSLDSQCYPRYAYSECKVSEAGNKIDFKSADLITISASFPKGLVSEVFKLYHLLLPFINYRYESVWFLLLPLLFFIYMFWLFVKSGRDPNGKKTIVPEFEIPDHLAPAQMGAILDEKVGKKEISSTFVDLVFKGFIKIEEIKKKSFFRAKKDYQIYKLKKSEDALESYEKKVLKAIFSDGEKVKLSDLKKSTNQNIRENLQTAEKEIYKSVTAQKYFVASPQTIRNKFLGIGIAISTLGVILVILSFVLEKGSGSLSFAAALIGIICLAFSPFMPKRTKKGVLMRERILGFKMYMEKAEKYRSKWQEQENLITQFLPYAVLFGITTSWLRSLKKIGVNVEKVFSDSHFYYVPIYTIDSVASSVNDIGVNVDSVSDHSFSSSGSSGGGFGGGFGGGGGGSW